jgi:hypothetical protein
MERVFFFTALSLILTHELDAVRQREWRIFPGLRRLDDERGYQVFTSLHVPLFLLLLGGLFASDFNQSLATGLSAFCVLHTALHLLALWHPENRFRSALSWGLIGGAGLCGALDLLLGA